MGITRFLVLVFLIMAMTGDRTVTAGTPLSATATLAPMVEKVLPSVVSIAVTGTSQTDSTPLLSGPFFRQFLKGLGQLLPVEIPFSVQGRV